MAVAMMVLYGVVKDVAPVGERRVGGDDSGTLLRVTVGDDLVKRGWSSAGRVTDSRVRHRSA